MWGKPLFGGNTDYIQKTQKVQRKSKKIFLVCDYNISPYERAIVFLCPGIFFFIDTATLPQVF